MLAFLSPPETVRPGSRVGVAGGDRDMAARLRRMMLYFGNCVLRDASKLNTRLRFPTSVNPLRLG